MEEAMNKILVVVVAAGLLPMACGGSQPAVEGQGDEQEAAEEQPDATAVLEPTAGNQVAGSVSFTQVGGHVRVHAEVSGLTVGDHGFHVHEKGDCTDPAGKSAGGHFNPDGLDHGGPHDAIRHVGDLGNLTADASGKAVLDTLDSLIKLDGPNSVLGRALIVHAEADDLSSQPTGAAGARVACGVIEAN
jgi:Cu-Zn family superoxide dismutase